MLSWTKSLAIAVACTLAGTGTGVTAESTDPKYITPIADDMTGLTARNPTTRQMVRLYSESHALLIGQADYHNWDKLAAVPREVYELRDALEKQHFKVEVYLNLHSDEIVPVIDRFMRKHATVRDSRILFYMSGHGWSRSITPPIGYLIPVDAPRDEGQVSIQALAASAISTTMFEAWARMPDPRHMLFVFDACFSGSLFGILNSDDSQPTPVEAGSGQPTNVPVVPQSSSEISFLYKNYPIAHGIEGDDAVFRPPPYLHGRQFMTAGLWNEVAPKDSIFTRLLIDLLDGKRTRDAAINFDRWTTASTLGAWLQRYGRKEYQGKSNPTTPLFGQLRDPSYDHGDMIFARLDLLNSVGEVQDLDPWKNVDSAMNQRKSLVASTMEERERAMSQETALRAVEAREAVLKSALAGARLSDSLAQSRPHNLQTSGQVVIGDMIIPTPNLIVPTPNLSMFQNYTVMTLQEFFRSSLELEAVKSQVRQLSLSADQANKEAHAADAVTERARAVKPSNTPQVSPDIENRLQSIVNALSSDESVERRSARSTLASIVQTMPDVQAQAVVARLTRQLFRKSYRYQLGIATALEEQSRPFGKIFTEEAHEELIRAAKLNRDPTLASAFARALSHP